MSALLTAHHRYIAKFKAKGGRVLEFMTPCCGQLLEDAVPDGGETWSSMVQCPYCDGLFFQSATRAFVSARIPAGDKRCTCHSNGEQYCRQHSDGMPRNEVRGS